MTSFVLMNPGSGSVDGTCTVKDATENIRVFIRDLTNMGLAKPRARWQRFCDEGLDDTGRVAFWLTRGDRKIDVSMPGRPTHEVRDQDGRLAHIPPRLYVDGNSWYWKFATKIVFEQLLDWNGEIRRANVRAKRRAQYEIRQRPRCLTCNSIRELVDGAQTVRCLACAPQTFEREGRWGDTIVIRRLPPGAFGTDDDPMCRKYVNSIPTSGYNTWHNFCRLANRHEGPCEGDYTFTRKVTS